jgi:hypothetical protein
MERKRSTVRVFYVSFAVCAKKSLHFCSSALNKKGGNYNTATIYQVLVIWYCKCILSNHIWEDTLFRAKKIERNEKKKKRKQVGRISHLLLFLILLFAFFFFFFCFSFTSRFYTMTVSRRNIVCATCLTFLLPAIFGYQTGPLKSACDDMTPLHGLLPSTDPFEYTISTSSRTYCKTSRITGINPITYTHVTSENDRTTY